MSAGLRLLKFQGPPPPFIEPALLDILVGVAVLDRMCPDALPLTAQFFTTVIENLEQRGYNFAALPAPKPRALRRVARDLKGLMVVNGGARGDIG